MQSEIESIKRLKNPKYKVSCHYLINRKGEITNLVEDRKVAWHAGKSKWKKFISLNKYSIGIEISNPGHDFKYPSFSLNQIKELKKLLRYLIKKYKIHRQNVLGHSDIAPFRKKDPGEKFPWRELAKKKLCKWHNLSINELKKFREVDISKKNKKLFLTNLSVIGYSVSEKMKFEKKNSYIISAFQRRFRQDLINGTIDKECFLISKKLAKI